MSEPRWIVWKTLSGDEKAARIYDVLLDASNLSASEIAERVQIPRTTLYPAIEWLKQHGLLTQKESGREVRYTAAAPQAWQAVAEASRAQMEMIEHTMRLRLPGWAAAYEAVHRPRVRAFEGEEGLKALRAEVFSMEGEVWEYFAVDPTLKQMAQIEQHKRVQGTAALPRGRVLMALEDPQDVPPFFDRRSCEVRWIAQTTAPFTGSLTLVESRAYLLSSREHPVGLVVESADVVQLLRTLFEAKWREGAIWTPPQGWGLAAEK